VVVCTKDRPDDLRRAVLSILRSSYGDFELVVIDQSMTDLSKAIVEGVAAGDNRVCYLRDTGVGASRARNIGLSNTRGDIVAFTDDDCEVERDWLQVMVGALREDHAAGLAYGAVHPVPHDTRLGFIVGFTPEKRRRLTGRIGKLRDAGIGASMAMRREAVSRVGPFDEMLGPGAYLISAEDCDMTYRFLADGYAVLHLPDARVLHYGWRDFGSGRTLMRRTYVAVAAAYTKPLRAGDPVGALLLGHELLLALATVGGALLRRRGPFGFGRLAALFVGVVKSFELGLQNRPLLFKAPKSP
jgi:glycosyltransferase involved in cell wall biosynthesis